jgi:hypothetical protein
MGAAMAAQAAAEVLWGDQQPLLCALSSSSVPNPAERFLECLTDPTVRQYRRPRQPPPCAHASRHHVHTCKWLGRPPSHAQSTRPCCSTDGRHGQGGPFHH